MGDLIQARSVSDGVPCSVLPIPRLTPRAFIGRVLHTSPERKRWGSLFPADPRGEPIRNIHPVVGQGTQCR
jgi:hypothetical protein